MNVYANLIDSMVGHPKVRIPSFKLAAVLNPI